MEKVKVNKKASLEGHKEWLMDKEDGMPGLMGCLLEDGTKSKLFNEYFITMVKYSLSTVYEYTWILLISLIPAWRLFLLHMIDGDIQGAVSSYVNIINSERMYAELVRIASKEVAYKQYVFLCFLIAPKSYKSFMKINRFYWTLEPMKEIRNAFDYVGAVRRGYMDNSEYEARMNKIYKLESELFDIHRGRNLEYVSDEEWETEEA